MAADVGLDLGGAKDGGFTWADFNNDGLLDLFVNTNVDNATGRSRLYFARRDGAAIVFDDVTADRAPGITRVLTERSAVAADLNDDGYVDFVRNANPIVEVYFNQGPPSYNFGVQVGGTAGVPNFTLRNSSGPNPGAPFNNNVGGLNTEMVAILDANKDGALDILADNHGNGFVLLRNPGNGTANFTQVATAVSGLPSSGTSVGDYGAVGDFDVDGDIDIFARKDNGFDIWLGASGASFAFTPNTAFDYGAPNGNKGANILCDFNEDGLFDLFYTDGGVSLITNDDFTAGDGPNQIFLARPDGTLVPTELPAFPGALPADIYGAACGDVDNDGDLDLFLARDGVDELWINRFRETDLLQFERSAQSFASGNSEGV